jgi:glucokinase
MILAGDVGGTKVHLALYGFEGGRLKQVRDGRFPAHESVSLVAVVDKFLAIDANGNPTQDRSERDQLVAACFGVPGPVRDGRLKLTNLPWVLDAHDIAQSLGIQHIFLINDLEATGYGIPELGAESICTLAQGDRAAFGHRGLIAAGTGLGQALLIWDGHTYRPIPSEGGHCDFAPRNDREIGLLQYLRKALNGHVSWERVVSGIGIKNVYTYLRDVERLEEPAWLRDRMLAEDPNAAIGTCAEDGSSRLCFETMQLFASAYGAEAGNLALKALALGGIYVGGGIAPKMIKTLNSGGFMQAFLDKGRLTPVLQSIPVRIILDEACALLGAAAFAEARAAEISGRSERAASFHV